MHDNACALLGDSKARFLSCNQCEQCILWVMFLDVSANRKGGASFRVKIETSEPSNGPYCKGNKKIQALTG